MRINRSKGVSVTTFSASNRLERKLRLASSGNDVSLVNLTKNDPDLLVRQYISGIDKVLSKPKKPEDMHLHWYRLRSALGAAVWDCLVARLPNSVQEDRKEFGRIKRNWEWKLHPYAKEKTLQAYEQLLDSDKWKIGRNGKPKPLANYRGSRFSLYASGENLDVAAAAVGIDVHLFSQERRIDGTLRSSRGSTPNSTGLVEARARSIENSVYLKHHKAGEISNPPVWTADDLRMYGKHDLAAAIYKKATDKENKVGGNGKPTPQRLSSKDVGAALFEHYSAIGLCDQSMEPESRQRLQALHNAVRELYRRLVKNSKRGTESHKSHKLSARLPRDHAALISLMEKTEENAVIGDLIRHGRNAYYARINQDRFGDNAEEASRYFWTSEGQAEIKRSEAFTRIWRTVKDQAARTAKSWADRTGDFRDTESGIVSDDILLEKAIRQVTNDAFDHGWFETKAQLLLGGAAKPFLQATPEVQRQIMLALLKITSRIRTDVVHFTSRKKFAERLQASISKMLADGLISEETQAIVRNLYVTDERELCARVERDLSGALVHEFVSPELYRALLTELNVKATSDIPLPRFNRLVSRLHGTVEHLPEDQRGLRANIAMKVNRLALETPHLRARYVALKALYEKRFALWLAGLEENQLQRFLHQALDEGARLARTPHSNSPFVALIRPKIDRVRLTPEGGVLRIFDDLAGIVATEMRDQNAYEANPSKAREESEWVEQFKCDLLAIAFVAYIEESDFQRLAMLRDTDRAQRDPPKTSLAEQPLRDNVDWLANLYLFLHLVPVEDVSGLSHQFRKMAVLEPNVQDDTSVANAVMRDVQQVVALYLAMNADKFEGTTTRIDTENFGPFFENPQDFERIYEGEDSTDAPVVSLKRGLRQIMRFGHLRRLERIFKNNKVTVSAVNEVFAAERKRPGEASSIAVVQKQREELHQRLVRARFVEPRQLEEYSRLVESISRHRHAASNVRLTTHLSLHHLMMRVLSRLIDYAGTWERDRMFVFLGLIAEQNARASAHGEKPIFTLTSSNLSRLTGGRVWYRQKDGVGEAILPDLLTAENRALFDTHFGKEKAQIRNDFAHYNNISLDRDDIDLTAEMNRIRNLLAYDRKLKNVVSKSIKDLLEREGFSISWNTESHELRLKSVLSDKIDHLAAAVKKLKDRDQRAMLQAKLKETRHSRLMVNMVAELFRESPSER